jgi:hypothetical protein
MSQTSPEPVCPQLQSPGLTPESNATDKGAGLKQQIAELRRQNQVLESTNLQLRGRSTRLEERLLAPHYQLADRLRRAGRRIPGIRHAAEPALRMALYLIARHSRQPLLTDELTVLQRTRELRPVETITPIHASSDSPEDVSRRTASLRVQVEEISRAGQRIGLETQRLQLRLADLETRLGERRYRIADVLLRLTLRYPWLRRAAEPLARAAWMVGRRFRQVISP